MISSYVYFSGLLVSATLLKKKTFWISHSLKDITLGILSMKRLANINARFPMPCFKNTRRRSANTNMALDTVLTYIIRL